MERKSREFEKRREKVGNLKKETISQEFVKKRGKNQDFSFKKMFDSGVRKCKTHLKKLLI